MDKTIKSKFSFLLRGLSVILFLDIIMFLGPGGLQIKVLFDLIFWPLRGFQMYGHLGYTEILKMIIFIITLVLGMLSYAYYPRKLTKVVTVLALIMWFFLGVSTAFIRV